MPTDASDTGSVPATVQGVAVPDAPPHPLDGQWDMRVDGREYGPYTGYRLKEFATEGRLEPQTEVRRPGGSWIAARTDTALGAFFEEDLPPVRSKAPWGSEDSSQVTARKGATIVQVHNVVEQPKQAPVAMDPGANKSPGLALFLSLMIVGLGQIYNGDVFKGILMFIGCIMLWAAMLGWIVNIWSMVDAYIQAKERRQKYENYHRSYSVA